MFISTLCIFKNPPLNSSARGLCLEVKKKKKNASFSKLITHKRTTWGAGYRSLLCEGFSLQMCLMCAK